jgi:hypothetical protein
MIQEERLKFCRICKNRKSDRSRGIFCGKTNQIADFEETCNLFEENEELIAEFNAVSKDYELSLKVPGNGIRFLNHILDFIFIFILCLIGGILMGILAIVSPESVSALPGGGWFMPYLISFMIWFIYYSTFEAITGRTIGKSLALRCF